MTARSLGDEAAFEAEGDDGEGLGREFAAVGPGVGRVDGDAVLAQEVGEALAGAAGPGGDDGAAAAARRLRPGP